MGASRKVRWIGLAALALGAFAASWALGRGPVGPTLAIELDLREAAGGRGRVRIEAGVEGLERLELRGLLSDRQLGVREFAAHDEHGLPLPWIEDVRELGTERAPSRFTSRSIELPPGTRRLTIEYGFRPTRYLPPSGEHVQRECGWLSTSGCALGLASFLLVPSAGVAGLELRTRLPSDWSIARALPERAGSVDEAWLWRAALVAWSGATERSELAPGIEWLEPRGLGQPLGREELVVVARRLRELFGDPRRPVRVLALPAGAAELEIELPGAPPFLLWHAPAPGSEVPRRILRSLYPLWFGRTAMELALDSSEEAAFARALEEYLAQTLPEELGLSERSARLRLENTWLREPDLRRAWLSEPAIQDHAGALFARMGGALLGYALECYFESRGEAGLLERLAGYDGRRLPPELRDPELWGAFRGWLAGMRAPDGWHLDFEDEWALELRPEPLRGREGEPAEKVLELLFTSDTEGFLETCGCKLAQKGGVARRATAVRAVRAHDPGALLIDLGNFAPVERTLPRLDPLLAAEVGLYLESMLRLGYDAVCIGPTDLYSGSALVRGLDGGPELPWIAAGVELPGGGAYPHSRVLERQGLRIGILAYSELLEQGYLHQAQEAQLAGVTFPRDVASVLPELRALRERVDLLVVAGRMRSESLRALSTPELGVDLVLVGGAGQFEPWKGGPVGYLGSTLVALDVERSYGLDHLTLYLTRRGAIRAHDWRAIELPPDVQPDAEMQGLLDAFYTELERREDLREGREPRLGWDERQEGGYVGSDACGLCHAEEHSQWLATPHADALRTLTRVRRDHHPKCVSCHVVGYGRPGGYDAGRPESALAGVGCELCHGAGAAHSAEPSRANIRKSPERRICSDCHDSEHSEAFESRWPEAWRAVQHR